MRRNTAQNIASTLKVHLTIDKKILAYNNYCQFCFRFFIIFSIKILCMLRSKAVGMAQKGFTIAIPI